MPIQALWINPRAKLTRQTFLAQWRALSDTIAAGRQAEQERDALRARALRDGLADAIAEVEPAPSPAAPAKREPAPDLVRVLVRESFLSADGRHGGNNGDVVDIPRDFAEKLVELGRVELVAPTVPLHRARWII